VIYGMDTESVARLSSRLATVAARVRELEARLTAQLAVTSWVGHDRDRFDGEWQSAHVRALRSAADALDDAARVAAENVSDQDRASA
jgi:uncharacterized protein YukE